VPGLNIPDIYYYKDEGVKQRISELDRVILDLKSYRDKCFLEGYNNYDPEETYYVVFHRYTKSGAVSIWQNQIKIVSEETWNKKFEFLNVVKALDALDQETCLNPKEIH